MSSWIKDKVVEVAKAEAEETGKDAEDIIWQLSKELGKLVEAGKIDADERFQPEDGIIGNIDPGYAPLGHLKPEQLITEPTREMLTEALTPAQLAGLEPIASGGSEFDVIKKPSHYAEGRKYEPKDVIRDWGLNFNLGSSVKYISRLGRKDDEIQEIEKAITFLEFERDARKAERDEAAD